MATDHFTTPLALPRFLLRLEEFLHSMFSDELQIFYHTHPVARPVSFVKCPQSVAWKGCALETIGDLTFGQLGALFLEKRTFLVSWSAPCALDHSDPFCLQVMLQS